MRIKGIKRGRTIELCERLDTIPDGTEITVELELSANSVEESSEAARLSRLNRLFGTWRSQPELMEIFAEIDYERHTDQGRQIDLLEQ